MTRGAVCSALSSLSIMIKLRFVLTHIISARNEHTYKMMPDTQLPPAIQDTQEISFRELLLSIIEMARTIWKSRILLTSVIVATTAFAIWYSTYISTYRSEGYFQVAMSQLEYKRLLAYVAAPGRWQNFAKTLTADEQQAMKGLDGVLMDKKQMQNLITPIYPITKAEMKDLPDAASKDITANISGFLITNKAKTPEAAQRGVISLGNFLRDIAILMNFTDSTRAKYPEYLSSQRKYENAVIDIKHNLELLQNKKSDIQKILRNYPESTKTDGRQLISLAEGGERFLSPITHLVAIEYSIADQNRNLPELLRNQRINIINLNYLEKVMALLDKSTSGVEFIKALPQIKDSLNLHMNDELEKSVYNSITTDILNQQSLYFEKMNFIAEPVLSRQRSSSRLHMGILGLTLGTLFGCIFILLRDYLRRLNTFTPATQEETSTGTA